MISAYLTEKNETKMSSVAQIEARYHVGPHGLSRGWPFGLEGPFLGLYTNPLGLNVLQMISAYLAEQNELKMKSLVQPEFYNFGARTPYLNGWIW